MMSENGVKLISSVAKVARCNFTGAIYAEFDANVAVSTLCIKGNFMALLSFS